MFYPKKLIVPVFVCAVLAGVGLHFLYARFPCTLSALLSPVCESLWEHIKILYWPYLAASAFLAWGRPTGMRPWLLSLVILCPLMLVLGLLLHAALALHALWLDIALYLGLMAFGFWFPVRFSGPFRNPGFPSGGADPPVHLFPACRGALCRPVLIFGMTFRGRCGKIPLRR